jgi:putative endonuclease
MASESGTLYIGVTNNLLRRINEHKNDLNEGFTKKYQCHKLVYFESYGSPGSAIAREKQIKKWNRDKKSELIKSINKGWCDLSLDWIENQPQAVKVKTINKCIRKGISRLRSKWV